MAKYKTLAVTTKYWKPGHDFIDEIAKSIGVAISDGDFVVISEKAISTAISNIVDEAYVKPTLGARLIAHCWMRILWGYFLGPLLHFRLRMLRWLREYPIDIGSRHKQVILQYAGLLQALMFGSEGAIDGSNLAYSYVSLPLGNAHEIAQHVLKHILLKLEKRVFVIIADTDKTYSILNFHFTPRPKPIKGIYSFGGVISYLAGRLLKLKKRATPLAVAGCKLSSEEALRIASVANRARGHGAGKTVWDMAEKLGVGLDEVTWEMLDTVKHKPIVIVRRKT